MAIRLQSKPNVIPPGGDYPYGDIKDNSGSADGTPLNKLVHADFHQFFAKLLADGGVTGNDLPDNNLNGFQYAQALNNIVQTFVAVETALRVSAVSSEASTRASADTALDTAKVNRSGDTITGTLIVQGGINRGSGLFKEAIIPIGPWNMDANSSVEVLLPGAVGSYKNVRGISSVLVRDDSDTVYASGVFGPFSPAVEIGSSAGLTTIGSNNCIVLIRLTGGVFDDPSYSSVAGSYNRGWIVISYQ